MGAIVIEVPDHFLGPRVAPITDLDIQRLMDTGIVRAMLVEDHAKTDGRPLCRLIGGDSVPADLPLVPFLLADVDK